MKKVLVFLSVLFFGMLSANGNDLGDQKKEDQGHPPVSYGQICQVSGQLEGVGISVGLGGQFLHGDGTITCINSAGHFVGAYPVRLHFITGGLGLDLTLIRDITYLSAPIRVEKGFTDLTGSYAVGISTGITLLDAGINYDSALSMSTDSGHSFDAALTGRDAFGLGVRLHAAKFHIHLL